ncbi:DUF4183 domain-containing protein [Brevibacillus sp. SYSU BS000544]|uniref:DUF4183 domain-containing protein n=1 Tax=Brevibacillus sp. SYSU BS000544 TaxID=3416443 RepID=UPI003CE57F6E
MSMKCRSRRISIKVKSRLVIHERSGCKSSCKRKKKKHRKIIKKTDTVYYYATANGVSRTFTNKDGIKGYSTQGIPNPAGFSLINLFINGVLQPQAMYLVKKGLLILRSSDIPQKGVPIILQMIRIY